MSIQRVSICYVTFKRDHDFLVKSLESVRKYASGFCGITVVVPTVDIDYFLHLEKDFQIPECPLLIRTFLEFPGKGFVHHAAMICYADVFRQDCTHILHLDPDCLFTSKVTPQDYFVDGKPVLLVEPFEAIRRDGHDGRYQWKKCAEEALKFPVTHETMCRHPAIHHSWLYKALRSHIESRHGTPFIDYVLRQKNEFPQSFAEFPTIGAYAMEFAKDQYHFIDRGFDREKNDPAPKLKQFWSYHGIAGSNKAEIDHILA